MCESCICMHSHGWVASRRPLYFHPKDIQVHLLQTPPFFRVKLIFSYSLPHLLLRCLVSSCISIATNVIVRAGKINRLVRWMLGKLLVEVSRKLAIFSQVLCFKILSICTRARSRRTRRWTGFMKKVS